MNIWNCVKKFHKAFNLPVNRTPINLGVYDMSIIMDLKNLQSTLQAVRHKLNNRQSIVTAENIKLRMLRVSLLLEEVTEYLKAEEDNDMVEIADALGDIHYIVAGTELAYGIDGEAVFKEIQDSNMAKLDSEGNPKYDGTGKVVKPLGWEPPKIANVLSRVVQSVSKDSSHS